MVAAAENMEPSEPVNLGSGAEISIRDLVDLIVRHTGFQGEIVYDSSRPDGQPRRCLDVTKAKQLLGFQSQMSLDEGLRRAIAWYAAEKKRTLTSPRDKQAA